MKLQQLTESTSLSSDYLDKFRDEVGDAIRAFDKEMQAEGLKIIEFVNDPDDESEFGVVYSNKIVDVAFEISIVPGTRGVGSEAYNLWVQISLADEYTVGAGHTHPSEIESFTVNKIEDEDALIVRIKLASNTAKKFIKPIVDWYFDVSGEYGRVKMYVETRDMENKLRAVAGDFNLIKLHGEVY